MIRTQGLCYQYPNGPLLAFPDVDVPQGAVLLLSGPSGCGKSTWLALGRRCCQPWAPTASACWNFCRVAKSHCIDAHRSSYEK